MIDFITINFYWAIIINKSYQKKNKKNILIQNVFNDKIFQQTSHK